MRFAFTTKQIFLCCCETQYCLLPVTGLIKDMIAVAAHTLTAEQSRESAANRDHFLRNAHLVLWHGFTNHKLANLCD